VIRTQISYLLYLGWVQMKGYLNFEIDGSHQYIRHDQALAGLKRTYYAFEKGYYTLRIPNSLVKSHPIETADYVADFVELRLRKRS